MSVSLAETTIFISQEKLEPVVRNLREAKLAVLPHPVSAVHVGKDGETAGRMVDVLGVYPQLAQALARTLTANGLNELNKPVIIFPFIPSE